MRPSASTWRQRQLTVDERIASGRGARLVPVRQVARMGGLEAWHEHFEAGMLLDLVRTSSGGDLDPVRRLTCTGGSWMARLSRSSPTCPRPHEHR